MKFFVILLLALFYSCKKNEKKQYELNEELVKEVKEKKSIENYQLLVDTLTINEEKFIVIQNDPRDEERMDLFILNSKRDTIYIHDGFASNGFEFEDFDKNGVLDIRLNHITNVGGISELIFYDKNNKKFKPVKDFENYPSPIKIKSSEYYYSYERAGCADYNWESNLFYISDYKCVKIGNIIGKGCGYEKRNGIFINKIINDKEVEIKWIKRDEGYYEDKWEFIENYWTRNYLKFIKKSNL
mgnify:FL=1